MNYVFFSVKIVFLKITLAEQWHVTIQEKQRPILLYPYTDVQAHNIYIIASYL